MSQKSKERVQVDNRTESTLATKDLPVPFEASDSHLSFRYILALVNSGGCIKELRLEACRLGLRQMHQASLPCGLGARLHTSSTNSHNPSKPR